MNLIDKYNNKKVFITGITGFKGSHLALLLKKMGADVYGLGLENPRKDTVFYQAKVDEKVKVYIKNLRDDFGEEIENHIKSSDYIFHFGAQAIVSEGYRDPYNTFDANVMGTVKILELIRQSNKEIKFLSVASDRVYESTKEPHKENSVLNGHDPYSMSKVFQNKLVDLYNEMHIVPDNIRMINARASNVLGPGDKGINRIVTTILDAMPDKTVELRNPKFVRPYIYVYDCLMQYLIILAFGEFNEYNIGAGSNTSVQVIELVNSFKRYANNLVVTDTGKKFGFEGDTLLVDTSRFAEEFGVSSIIQNIDNIVDRIMMYELSNKKEEIVDVLIDEAITVYNKEY